MGLTSLVALLKETIRFRLVLKLKELYYNIPIPQILQMHAHWGKKDGGGSEHTIDGKQYDAELHIVHYNDKYGDPSQAVDKPDGLAVLGMFLKAGSSHGELEKICKNLASVPTKDKSVVKDEDFLDPTKFLPGNKTFFTYPGSLTTPPLFESVTWIVFKLVSTLVYNHK